MKLVFLVTDSFLSKQEEVVDGLTKAGVTITKKEEKVGIIRGEVDNPDFRTLEQIPGISHARREFPEEALSA